MSSLGFGLAHIKREGGPAHPDDIMYSCGCVKCRARMMIQAKAYFDDMRACGMPESTLAMEAMYQPTTALWELSI